MNPFDKKEEKDRKIKPLGDGGFSRWWKSPSSFTFSEVDEDCFLLLFSLPALRLVKIERSLPL